MYILVDVHSGVACTRHMSPPPLRWQMNDLPTLGIVPRWPLVPRFSSPPDVLSTVSVAIQRRRHLKAYGPLNSRLPSMHAGRTTRISIQLQLVQHIHYSTVYSIQFTLVILVPENHLSTYSIMSRGDSIEQICDIMMRFEYLTGILYTDNMKNCRCVQNWTRAFWRQVPCLPEAYSWCPLGLFDLRNAGWLSLVEHIHIIHSLISRVLGTGVWIGLFFDPKNIRSNPYLPEVV